MIKPNPMFDAFFSSFSIIARLLIASSAIEHGLLIGLLGRERTCALVIGEVEEPSDIPGMVYEQLSDVKGDALRIARVLKQAGYSVDASGLL